MFITPVASQPTAPANDDAGLDPDRLRYSISIDCTDSRSRLAALTAHWAQACVYTLKLTGGTRARAHRKRTRTHHDAHDLDTHPIVTRRRNASHARTHAAVNGRRYAACHAEMQSIACDENATAVSLIHAIDAHPRHTPSQRWRRPRSHITARGGRLDERRKGKTLGL